ncbi:MAG: M48 family metalloprotease [Pseudomonadota bacterium]
MISRKRQLAALVLSGVVVACGKAPQSTETHDDGKIIRSSLSSNWMILDRATFLTKVVEVSENEALPANSFTTVRLQSWIDKIDAYARKRDPNVLASIPKPSVVVLKTSEANAYVSSTAVCYNVKVTFGDGVKSAPNGVYIDKTLDLLDVDIPANYPCIDVDPSDLPAIAEEISTRGQKCSFTVSPSGIAFPAACGTVDPAYKNGFTAPKLLLLKTPNWFVVLSGIADLLKNEESLVGVLAHELGHYYRSHSNTYKNEYDFFYTQNEAGNPNHKPTRDASLETFGKTVFQASAAYFPVSLIPDDNSLKLDPMLYLALGDIARQANTLPSCKKAATFEEPTTARGLGAMPFALPNSIDTFDEFAALANQCLADIEASESAKTKVNLASAIKSPKWAPYQNNPNLTKDQKTQLVDLAQTVFEVVGTDVTLPRAFTKNDVLKLAAALRANAGKIKQTLQKAYDAKLGQYTVEQEADDLSVEILSNIGLGGNSAVDTYMALVNPEEGLGGFEIGLQRCEKMRANNWIDPDGKFDIQILPVGDYSEVHHSGCYRAFNASREIAAHRYEPAAKAPLDPSVWAKITYELKTGKAGLIRTKKAKSPKNKLVFPKGCSFAPKA